MTGRGGASDTIFALASGAGRAAIAIIRMSGAQTKAILEAMCGLPAPRRASLRRLADSQGALLDRALVLWMPAPASYTGEDCAELHLHGGRAVVAAVMAALSAAGARPAMAGEFTRRAFLAGRLTLLEAEAIADLGQSDTESQRIQALRQMQGGADALLAGWAERLMRCLAFEEALIDFADENLPDDVPARNMEAIADLAADIAAHLRASIAGERVRSGLTFVICGPPNAGKSTLFNALAKREVAIVSPWPGTTRDVLEVALDLGGIAVTLVDTAGLRDAADAIEAAGIERARARIEAADLVIAVQEASARHDRVADDRTILVSSKCDLARPVGGTVGISVTTGEGLDALIGLLANRARMLSSDEIDPLFAKARHRAALGEAESSLAAAATCLLAELRAEELRTAKAALGRLRGDDGGTEAMLDVIFSAFCIGK